MDIPWSVAYCPYCFLVLFVLNFHCYRFVCATAFLAGIGVATPYRTSAYPGQVRTAYGQEFIYGHRGELSLYPDAEKARTSIPPNFVHSFDASHMFMTARQLIK